VIINGSDHRRQGKNMINETSFENFNGIEISNGTARIVVAREFGPRILAYSIGDGPNILGWHPHAAVTTDLGEWKPYGGHRLWMAPENMPLSYAPDGVPVRVERNGELSLSITGDIDAARVEKRMTITMDSSGSGVTIEHRLTNHGEPREMSAWALTIMAPGGEAVVPNEPFAPYSGETLLPVRSMGVWSYTDFTDPRWTFTKDEIRVRVDESLGNAQKIGVLNKQGLAGYRLNDLFFRKSFEFVEGATYPDMNSNTEIYTAGSFVEVESLSPLKRLEAGESITYVEKWELIRA
jgi:hypothetical protein